ncbi:MAG: hypothetical protein Q9175_006324, partial [Cornicularia normoerica]
MAHKAIPINMPLSKVPHRIHPYLSLNPLRASTASRYPINTPHIQSSPTTQPQRYEPGKLQLRPQSQPQPQNQSRTFTTNRPRHAAKTEAAELSTDQYHKLADQYIDRLVAQLEEMQEEREEVDVEYSVRLPLQPFHHHLPLRVADQDPHNQAGVLTLLFPPHGTYVLNKQPPNKQIWLS